MLQPHLMKRESKLEKCIELIINFDWLNQIHNPKEYFESNQSRDKILRKSMESCHHHQVLPYEEFRITKSQLIEREYIITDYISKFLTQNAIERCKYAIGQGLKYWRTFKEKDLSKHSSVYIIQHVNPNQLKESNENKKFEKVKVIDDFAFCSCMEHFNTGLPC